MRIFYYSLAFSIVLCVIGFSVAAFFSEREFGIKLFLLGFFFGGFSAALIMLASHSSRWFGRLGSELKITGFGFSLILVGLLLEILFGLDSPLKSFFFYIGVVLMTAGIIKTLLKLK